MRERMKALVLRPATWFLVAGLFVASAFIVTPTAVAHGSCSTSVGVPFKVGTNVLHANVIKDCTDSHAEVWMQISIQKLVSGQWMTIAADGIPMRECQNTSFCPGVFETQNFTGCAFYRTRVIQTFTKNVNGVTAHQTGVQNSPQTSNQICR